MARPPQERWQRDWYKIDVDVVRGVMIFALIMTIGYLGYLGWGLIEERYQHGRYQVARNEARSLQQSVRGNQGAIEYEEEYQAARANLRTAEDFATEKDWSEALRSAERGRTLLASILGSLNRAETNGQAQFTTVSSDVEFRRGERGSWQRAFSRGVLYAGDYVKTENGSAEIMGVDGTVYTVRSDTVILIGRTTGLGGTRTKRTIKLEHGWVNLSTSSSATTVSTPDAQAEVNEGSSALVAYDGTRRIARFAAYSGTVEVESSGGEMATLRPLEQVTQTGQSLSAKGRLPAAPRPVDPSDNLELRLDEHDRLVLSWQAVPGARLYALQVARNRLFVRNIIDVDDRSTTSATLGLMGDGMFVWRVAAIAEGGVVGPWSTARRFRVSSPPPVIEDEDTLAFAEASS